MCKRLWCTVVSSIYCQSAINIKIIITGIRDLASSSLVAECSKIGETLIAFGMESVIKYNTGSAAAAMVAKKSSLVLYSVHYNSSTTVCGLTTLLLIV